MYYDKNPSNIRILDISRRKMGVYIDNTHKWGETQSIDFIDRLILFSFDVSIYNVIMDKLQVLRKKTNIHCEDDLEKANKELPDVIELIYLQNIEEEYITLSKKDRCLHLQDHIKSAHKPSEYKIQFNKDVDPIKCITDKKNENKKEKKKSSIEEHDKEKFLHYESKVDFARNVIKINLSSPHTNTNNLESESEAEAEAEFESKPAESESESESESDSESD